MRKRLLLLVISVTLIIPTVTSQTITTLKKESAQQAEFSYSREITKATVSSKSVDANRSYQSVQSLQSSEQSTVSLPYLWSFEEDGDWVIWDPVQAESFPMGVGALNGLSALHGNYYLISGYDASGRNAWAFSPAFQLEAGTTYNTSIFVYATGYYDMKDEFRITVGSTQTEEGQTVIINDYSGDKAESFTDWTQIKGTFTPETSGVYYFGINHCTQGDVNGVAWDLFQVSNEAIILPPSYEIMYFGGLWSKEFVNYLPYEEPSIYFGYVFDGGTDSRWSFDSNTEVLQERDGIYWVEHQTTGNHLSTFTITTDEGEYKDDVEFEVKRPTDDTETVGNILPTDLFAAWTLSTNNYIFGPNLYWKQVGESYWFGEDNGFTLNGIELYVSVYNLTSTNQTKDFPITVYQIEDTEEGSLLTPLKTYTPTFAEIFGTSAITSTSSRKYTLPEPIHIEGGSIFVSFDFSNITSVSILNRIGLTSTHERLINHNTAYANYEGEWTPPGSLLQGSPVFSIAAFLDVEFDQSPLKEFTLEPYNNAVDIDLEAPVSITFHRDIEGSLEGIKINDEDATATISGNQLTINHEPFEHETLYTIFIPATALEGLEENIIWSFTTVPVEIIPPVVQGYSPNNLDTGIALDAEITVTFDKPVSKGDNFEQIVIKVKDGNELANVSAEIRENLIVIGHTNFEYETTYQVEIPVSAINHYEEAINWEFTTVIQQPELISKYPEGDEVTLNAEVAIEFDIPVTIVNTENISIKDTQENEVGNISATVEGNKLIIAHADFSYETTYTVTIPAETIRNYNEVIVWSFTTVEDPLVSINENEAESWGIYPNPARDNLQIRTAKDATVKLITITGETLQIVQSGGDIHLQLNYPDGLYFVQVENKGKITNHKLIIKK